MIEAPALNIDVAPTILESRRPAGAGRRSRASTGRRVLRGAEAPPHDRVIWFQAHKGAVLSAQEVESARRKGLLEVAVLSGGRKEIFRMVERKRWLFDLRRDPRETRSLARGVAVSTPLQDWLASVNVGLAASDRILTTRIDPESVQKLRALGYAE